MAHRLVLASHNQGKLTELRAILSDVLPAGEITSAEDLGSPEIKETGVTFAENALLKARALAESTGLVAVADDSGLAVEVLGGAPGIFSARWAGHQGDDQANFELLLAQLGDIAPDHRQAAFVCAAALVTPDGVEYVEYGYLQGRLATEPRGRGGFGYDPVLIPDGMDVTTAQISAEEKNLISHRGHAFRALAPHIAGVLPER